MTHPSKRKGNAFETEIVKELAARGVAAKKVPLSGALGGEYSHDLFIGPHSGECKRRARAWSDLFGFLKKGPDFLFCRSDRTETMVVMSLDKFVEILRGVQ